MTNIIMMLGFGMVASYIVSILEEKILLRKEMNRQMEKSNLEKYISDYNISLCEELIEENMQELEKKIEYYFKDISLLARAMGAIKIEIPDQGKNNKEYANSGLATLGDAILKAVLTDILYRSYGIQTKGQLTAKKSELEESNVLHKIMDGEKLIDYAFNRKHFYKDKGIPGNEKVVNNNHDQYIEAIVAAIYYDSNYDTVKKWIVKCLFPLLVKYKETNNK